MKNMTKQKLRKLEKKRRVEKQKRKLAKAPPLAYYGNKYRSEKYVFIMLATETAINEANVVSGKKLTDNDVKTSLIELIRQLRTGQLPALEDMSDEEKQFFGAGDFLASNILSHWRLYFEEHGPVSKDSLVGVLRTILASVEFNGSGRSGKCGYLEFLADFLANMGVRTRQISEEELDELEVIE